MTDPFEVRFGAVHTHPPYGADETVVTNDDPRFPALVAALRDAGFPRPPSTFANGGMPAPGSSNATLTVRTAQGDTSLSCGEHSWGQDAGYQRVLAALRAPSPSTPAHDFTAPTAPTGLEIGWRWGAIHAGGHHWLTILGKKGTVSYFIEEGRQPKRVAKGELTASEGAALVAAIATLPWRDRPPPFDAHAARTGHTPATINVRPGRDDQQYAVYALAFEQRHASPEWSRLFTQLDAIVARLTPLLA